MRKWLAIVIVVILAGVAWQVFGSSRRTAIPTSRSTAAVPVEVAPVQTRTLTKVMQAGGTVQAVHEVVVTAKISGRVASVRVTEGDRVLAGQVLVRLEESEQRAQLQVAEANLAAAQARLRMIESGARSEERVQVEQAVVQARANFDTAKENLDRMESLLVSGAVSQSQLDAARLQYNVARAQYESARQQLQAVQTGARPEERQMAEAQARQAEAAVTYAQLQVANTTIIAPLAGIITARSVEPGNMANPGAALMTVAQIDTVHVVLDISETDLSRVAVGQMVAVRADAYPDATFEGRVAEIGQAADTPTRVFKVKVAVANDHHRLKPGMFAHAEITTQRVEGALVIPRDAVVTTDGKAVVFVVDGDKARARPVELGAADGPVVEVRSGVTAGESVVVAGQTDLTDGMTVLVR